MTSDGYHDKFVGMFDILKWDGSYLGQWSKVEIIRGSTRSNPFSIIKFNRITIEVQIYQSSVPYMCLVDEMKDIFKLRKRGTHWFKRGENSVIITQAYAKTITLKDFMFNNNYTPIDLQNNLPTLYREILEIYIFRNLFGVKNSNLSSIKIINHSVKRNTYRALSIGEVNPIDSRQIAELPYKIIDEYFGNLDPEQIAIDIYRRCIDNQHNRSSKPVRRSIDISTYISAFNDLIDDVAKRIDKRLVHYTSDIKPTFLNTMSSYRGNYPYRSNHSYVVSGPPIHYRK